MEKIYFKKTAQGSSYVEIPFPKSWVENQQKIKKTFTSETGGETDLIVRDHKLVVSVGTTCLDDLLQLLFQFRNEDFFYLKKYDPLTKSSTADIPVRITDFNYGLVEKSAGLTATNGVWDVSYNLEEF